MDASLSNLSIGNLVLVPVFDPVVNNYSADAVYRISDADVVATTNDAAASVAINGGVNANVPITLGDTTITVNVTAEDTLAMMSYEIIVSRANFAQQAYVKASNTGLNDFYAQDNVSLSGDGATMAVGATGEGSIATGINGDQANNLRIGSGATYVYTRDSTGAWSQQAFIKASNTQSQDRFGVATSLSADGNTLAVGAHRESSSATGINGDETDNAAGVSGAVYVFTRDAGGNWSQQAYVKASNTDAGDIFGERLSISGDGNTLAVAARTEDSFSTGIDGGQSGAGIANTGAVYVFSRDGAGAWSQQAYVKASNTGMTDGFGSDVGLSHDGDTMAVGAIAEDSDAIGVNGDQANDNLQNSGAVYLFTRSATQWSQQAYIKASTMDESDVFGAVLAISGSGDTLAVASQGDDSNATGINGDEADNSLIVPGAVYVFTRDTGGVWTQQAYVKASNTESFDSFGDHVAISANGDVLAISAMEESSNATGLNGDQSDNTLDDTGAVYQFVRDSGGNWTQEFYIKGTNTDVEDWFGSGLALSADGTTLAVGAYREDSGATGIDGDGTDDSQIDSGAVYVFQ